VITSRNNHTVEFYNDDLLLIDSVAAYLKGGDAAIVICTPQHKKLLRKRLGNSMACQYFDAETTLAGFMVGGTPNGRLFAETVGAIVEAQAAQHKDVRAFGEMVAILWDQGKASGALLLEELWNDLLRKHAFTLHCAYPERAFESHRSRHDFKDVCGTHTASTFSNITFIT